VDEQSENKFVYGNRIVTCIREALKTTDQVDFAVAYWGKNATERLGLDQINKPVRIICDLWSFACNPKEMTKLLEAGFELKTEDGLHAKVYLTTRSVIVGSANASANGLGEEDQENF
jgi:hypothetical protein